MKRIVGLLVLMVMSTFALTDSASAAAAPAPAPNGAFAEIAGCISGADNVLVSIVVDESLSLRETDPQALRVQGITSAIDALEQLAELSPDVNVEVSLSTFARTFSTLVDWRTMTRRSADDFRQTATSELPKRDSGNATDYRQALTGAKKDLESRAQGLEDADACKVLLWFTDGALDVDEQTGVAANEICQPGGIADSVRHAGINVVALALFTPGARVTSTQRDQLRAVAEGQGQDTSCGTVPLATDDAMGVYLDAADPASLQLLFAGAGALVAGGSSGGSVTCPGPGCPDGDFTLDIDPGISGARVIVQSAGDVQLTAPDGQSSALVDGFSGTLSGASVTSLRRDSLTTLNIAFSPYADERSSWLLEMSGSATVETYWFWGAELEMTRQTVTAGSDNLVEFALVAQDGTAIRPGLYRELIPSIEVAGESLPTEITKEGVIRAHYRMGSKSVPTNVPASATVTARTQGAGIALGPIKASGRLTVELPPAFPTISPATLDFGMLEGLGSRTAELIVQGSALGATKACLSGSMFNVPDRGQQDGLVSASRRCVSVPREGSRTLALTLTPENSADGVASGDITMELQSSEGEHLDVTVPASLDMVRVVDNAERWGFVVAFLLLALLIPVLLLIGSNWFLLGKFSMSSGTRIANVPVRVTSSGIERTGAARLIDPDDLSNVSFSGTKRGSRIAVEGTSIGLRAARILSLRAPRGVATASGARKLLSGFDARESPEKPQEAPVGLGAVDAGFVVVERVSDDGATGRLVVVVPPGVDADGAQERARRLSADIDWRRVIEHLQQVPLADPASPVTTKRTPLTSASQGPTTARESSGEPAAAPGLPDWLNDASPAAAVDVSSRAPRPKRRTRSREHAEIDTVTPPSNELPPLPDFLRDKDH